MNMRNNSKFYEYMEKEGGVILSNYTKEIFKNTSSLIKDTEKESFAAQMLVKTIANAILDSGKDKDLFIKTLKSEIMKLN